MIFVNRFCELSYASYVAISYFWKFYTTRNLRGQTIKNYESCERAVFCQKFLTYLYSDGKKIFVILRGAKKHIVDKKAKAMFFTINSPMPFFVESTSGKFDRNQKSV